MAGISRTMLLLIMFSKSACSTNQGSIPEVKSVIITAQEMQPKTVSEIPMPQGYCRITKNDAFALWLRSQLLKNDNTVYLYNGQKKANQQAQYAVLDISIGNRDLQQCADAVMRMRAEYLFSEKRFAEIIFKDFAGTRYTFNAPFTRQNFDAYLQRVFGMCGTASLAKQMNSITDITSVAPGNVIIRGGFPGHAAMVMDVAENEKGEKIYLLAQSYMPAQSIHILKNPMDSQISPWYKISSQEDIITPEYSFKSTEFKKWD